MYYKALLANSATSALRLHQRLPQVQLSREFLGKVFLEDSAHYLLYSMIFFYSPPVTCKKIYQKMFCPFKVILIFIITYRGIASSISLCIAPHLQLFFGIN
jgi:hypothetical protein